VLPQDILRQDLIFSDRHGVIDDFDFAKKELKITNTEKCYIISNYEDIDGQIMEFQAAFNKCYGRGLATIIMSLTGDKLYLETEIDYGKQNRFIGRR